MWDVLWTDPDRELVGEHRAKKGRDKKHDKDARGSPSPACGVDKDGLRPPATATTTASSKLRRHSVSSRSSLSSYAPDSPFAFLKPKTLRHSVTTRVKSSASSNLSARSPMSPAFDSRSRRSSGIVPAHAFDPHPDGGLAMDKSVDSGGELSPSCMSWHGQSFLSCCVHAHSRLSLNTSLNTSFVMTLTRKLTDSIFSKYPDSDALTSNSFTEGPTSELGKPTSFVQTLGPLSFVTKQTEISSTPRNEESEIDATSEVIISASPRSETRPTSPLPSHEESVYLQTLKSFADLTSSVQFSQTTPPVEPIAPLVPPLKSPLRAISTSQRWRYSQQQHNLDAWRPPEEWDCAPSDSQPQQNPPTIESLVEELSSAIVSDKPPLTPDLKTLLREVERMAAATPNVVLSRLKEVWDTEPGSELHVELEMEKKRWMLSALHHLDCVPAVDISLPPRRKIVQAEARKLLALYESPSKLSWLSQRWFCTDFGTATASYLAALHHGKQLYHMSPFPLSPTIFPNIQPISVPSVSPSIFPGAPGMFDQVYTLSLPSLCASSDLPAILANIARCLRPNGSLHLTLVDPLPGAAVLGHKLRAWLEENLVLNLEKHFRCTSPTRLFPFWLGKAGLRGAGSTLTTAKFYALPENARGDGAVDPDAKIEARNRDRCTRAELRSLVGRMLWAEVWGRYVTADKMWWDDAECVKECLELGTFWEYHSIEGVKDI